MDTKLRTCEQRQYSRGQHYCCHSNGYEDRFRRSFIPRRAKQREEGHTDSHCEEDGDCCVDRDDLTELGERQDDSLSEGDSCYHRGYRTAHDRDSNMADSRFGSPVSY